MTAGEQLQRGSPTSASRWQLTAPRYSLLLVALECLVLLGTMALLWPTTQSLLDRWEDTEGTAYTHGYLILAIVFWLLFRNRAAVQAVRPQPNLIAAVLLAIASLIWVVIVRGGVQTAHQMMLPLMMWLAMYAVLGRRVAMSNGFAIGFLYFAVPLWGLGNVVLQSVTVAVVDVLLQASAVPAYVEGNFVHLPNGTFEIAGGCSGLHFFIVGLALACLYGELHRDSLRIRIRLLAFALLLALLTNWLRVYTIITAGYLTDMQHYLVKVDHYRFGWVVFAVMMTVFFFFARRLPQRQAAIGAVSTTEASGVAAGPLSLALALSLGAVSLGPVWNYINPVAAAALPRPVATLPNPTAPWTGPLAVNGSSWAPVFIGADLQQHGQYVDGDRRVEMFVAVYASQSQGKELVAYDNSVVDAHDTINARAHISMPGSVTELVTATPSGTASVLWYFYLVDSLQTDRGIFAQLWYGLASLAGHPVSRVIALRAPCVPDCDSARTGLGDLIDAVDFHIPASAGYRQRS